MITRILSWAVGLSVVATLVVLGVRRANDQGPARRAATLPVVRIQRPSVRDLPILLYYPAELSAIQQVEIRPVEATGFITHITVDKGDRVSRGRVLARVDCPEYHERRRQAKDAIRSLEVLERNARLILGRLKPMGQRRFVSQLEIDTAEATVDRATARLRIQQAKLAEVEALLRYCTLRAPFSGEVLMRHVDVGAQVRPGGGPLLTLVGRTRMRVQLRVTARDGALIRNGLSARVTIHGLAGRVFPGRVTRFVRAVDPLTGTQLVEIEVPNRDRALQPGMFGRVEITVDRRPRAVIVPATAVLATSDGASLFVVEEGRVRRVQVQIGHDLGDEVEIREGLRGREALVVVGRDMVRDGSLVQVRE